VAVVAGSGKPNFVIYDRGPVGDLHIRDLRAHAVRGGETSGNNRVRLAWG
jgi:hypothetical protein